MSLALRKIDLNLMLIFDSVYRLGSVAEASRELALSPSALSHALNRLRQAFGDPLFLRTGGRMVPTVKAVEMAVNISSALRSISFCLHDPERFEPENSQATFTIAATDYTAAVILPALVDRVNHLAPGITIKLIYSHDFNADDDLISGRVDFALGFEEEEKLSPSGIESMPCFTDDYAVAVRRGHPEITNVLTPELYLRAGHVVVRPWLESRCAIEHYLESQRLHRKIVVELPSLMIAPLIVSQTNLVITLPRRGIGSIFDMKDLVVFATPFPTPQYVLKVYFRATLNDSPGQAWMREQIKNVCDSSGTANGNAVDQGPAVNR